MAALGQRRAAAHEDHAGPGNRRRRNPAHAARHGARPRRRRNRASRWPYRDVRAHAADKWENRYYDPTVKTEADGTFELAFDSARRTVHPGGSVLADGRAGPGRFDKDDGPRTGPNRRRRRARWSCRALDSSVLIAIANRCADRAAAAFDLGSVASAAFRQSVEVVHCIRHTPCGKCFRAQYTGSHGTTGQLAVPRRGMPIPDPHDLDRLRHGLYTAVVSDVLDSIGHARSQVLSVPLRSVSGHEVLVGRAKTTLWEVLDAVDPRPTNWNCKRLTSAGRAR